MHDSHIHMALSPLKENYLSDIDEFIKKGGKKILVQSTESSDLVETLEIVEKINNSFGDIADLALGLHPTIFAEAHQRDSSVDLYRYSKKQLELLEELFKKNSEKVKAVGECGLDYFEIYTYLNTTKEREEEIKEVQKIAFRAQCKIAKENDLPLSIHSRDIEESIQCTKDVLEILAEVGKGTLRGCFHSYTGSIEMLEDILNMGFYIGFNAIITYPSGDNVREILKKTPVERILFETDGPFLPTQSIRKNKKENKKYGRPVLIKEIIEIAAAIKGISAQKLEEETDTNYTNLFGKR
ncbi:MAG: TatD family hydrolase [Candidatus Dojkabacteria bacterium]